MMNSNFVKILNQKIEKKADLDKDFMTAYVLTNGSAEDVEWFGTLIKSNAVKRSNNVRGGDYISIELKVVRDAFCEHYEEFYRFSKKAKRELAKEKARENDIFANFLADAGIDLVSAVA